MRILKDIQLFLLIAILTSAQGLWATAFTSTDGIFTLDLPSGWKQVTTSSVPTVLALRKDTASIDIKAISCDNEACLDERINHDLAEVRAKKMTVITNTYTGEEIKRIEFSTGEPLYYISFFTSKNDFSAGYFLINEHAYSILAKNISYAEADLLFSFFAPVSTDAPLQNLAQVPEVEVDVNSPLSYETDALPEVEVEAIEAPIEQEEDLQKQQPSEQIEKPAPSFFKKLKRKLKRLRIRTLVSPQMPPYLRAMGHWLDAVVLLLMLYFCIWFTALGIRFFFTPRRKTKEENTSAAAYPIKTKRLYGTPALILRTKDNQGNVLISSGSRWNSICVCFGISTIVITILILAVISFAEQTKLLALSSLTYSAIYSSCSLILPLGLLLILTGIIWGLLILREVTLFDRKGKKAAAIVQKGFPLLYEKYDIYFANSKEGLHLLRKRFSLLRHWEVIDKDKKVLILIKERSVKKSILRRLFGHLWGFLRADYDITGLKNFNGQLNNSHSLFNTFVCNVKHPEMLPARDMAAITALISLRDRDKWYPWFN